MTRVLVLDDEPALRRSFGRMLQRRGAKVVLAATIEEAKHAVLEGGVDRVLSDVMLDQGTGPEFHTWLAEQQPSLAEHLVFMSGNCPDHLRAYIDGLPNPLLTKPITPDELFEAMGLR